jgi:hypothetical protein
MEFDQPPTEILSSTATDFEQVFETRDSRKQCYRPELERRRAYAKIFDNTRLGAHQFLLAILMTFVAFENEL